jgi:hypothetical protein
MAIQRITSGIIADGAIVATDIGDGVVTTAKIADGSITTAKLSSDAIPQIVKPTITSPANGASGVSLDATITATGYFSLYGRPQANAEWQLSTSSDFAFINVENTISGSNTQLTLNNSVAFANTTYYTRVRYSDDANNTSEYSDIVQFVTAASFEANVLVVGGGGGGGGCMSGYWAGGGGGAGGIAYATNQTILRDTTYTVTVGGGGTGGTAGPGPTYAPPGTNGTDSVFNNITAKGGGFGAGARYNQVSNSLGGPGGSGGGAGPHNPGGSAPDSLGGSATQPSQNPGISNLTNYGNAGGNGEFSTSTGGAGAGGGSAGAGTSWTPSNPANEALAGGSGTLFSISGTSVTYAAGGPTNNSSFSGFVNTGYGGGGGQGPTAPLIGGAGSSGVVILSYPTASANLTSVAPALTYSYTESGGNRIYKFTAGTGNITG